MPGGAVRRRHQRPEATAAGQLNSPEAWARASNVDIADRLAGRLLLIHGEMDDQVHPDHTLRMADRLIAADKDFELLIVPGAEHTFIDCLHYVRKRAWDLSRSRIRNRARQPASSRSMTRFLAACATHALIPSTSSGRSAAGPGASAGTGPRGGVRVGRGASAGMCPGVPAVATDAARRAGAGAAVPPGTPDRSGQTAFFACPVAAPAP